MTREIKDVYYETTMKLGQMDDLYCILVQMCQNNDEIIEAFKLEERQVFKRISTNPDKTAKITMEEKKEIKPPTAVNSLSKEDRDKLIEQINSLTQQ